MSSSNGHKPAPLDFPPDVDPREEFIKREVDPEDEVIEVGVAIVGGGTAGLATANRLLQLLGDDPELMESLGEVPVAVIEKAKTCGGHNLSGAVMRPEPLEQLFPDLTREQWREQGFAYGEVTKESVYMLTSAKRKLPVPIPLVPNFKNHGNEVISVSALARYQQEQAEEGGAYILTETSATQLLVEDGKVRGVRTGDKGRGKDGEPLGNFEPGTDVVAKHTVLAEGCWGHLTGAAIKEFDLAEGREPQVWELGVKEVWKVPKPLDRVIHTFGAVAAEAVAEVRPARRHVDLPDEGREDRATTWSRSASSSTSTTRTRPPRPTTCCSSSRRTRWSGASSRAASASPGARRRCRAAATGRCPSCRCRARCSSATPAAWSTRPR